MKMKLIEILKDDLYVNLSAVSHFYYDDEWGRYYISMTNGKEFKLADSKEEMKKILHILNDENNEKE